MVESRSYTHTPSIDWHVVDLLPTLPPPIRHPGFNFPSAGDTGTVDPNQKCEYDHIHFEAIW